MPRARAERPRILRWELSDPSEGFRKLRSYSIASFSWDITERPIGSFDYGAFGTDYVFGLGSEFVTGTGFGIGYEYKCNDMFFFRAAAVSE